MDSRFQSLVGFRIPKPRISDTKAKIYCIPESGFPYVGRTEGQSFCLPFSFYLLPGFAGGCFGGVPYMFLVLGSLRKTKRNFMPAVESTSSLLL